MERLVLLAQVQLVAAVDGFGPAAVVAVEPVAAEPAVAAFA